MTKCSVFTLAILIQILAGPLAWAGELRALIKDRAGHPVEDAVLLATPADGRKVAPPKPARDEVDQVDKDFVPHVKVVYINSQVRFPNKDNIRHHVYSFSPAKTFELPLYIGTPALPVLFDQAGVVVLGCNIHDWMLGYVYVADTPFFDKSQPDGTASIGNLPAGDYLFRVWQPRMEETEEATTRKLTIGSHAVVQAEWQLTLKPAARISRAAPGRSGSYR